LYETAFYDAFQGKVANPPTRIWGLNAALSETTVKA